MSIDNKDSKTPLLPQKQRPGAIAWEIDESITQSYKPKMEAPKEPTGMGGSAWEIEKDTMRSKGLISGAVVGMDKNQRLGFEQGYAYARANPSPEKFDSNKVGRKENFIVELEVKSKLN